MPEEDYTDDSRIDTIRRAIANPGTMKGSVKEWFERMFPLGWAMLHVVLVVLLLRQVVLIAQLWGSLSTWELIISSAIVILNILAVPYCTIMTFLFAAFWWIDEGERVEIYGISIKGQ